MCESASSTISCPGVVCATTDTRLPMVPDARKSPASLPISAADIASSRWTVGSSPQTSSPTSARAIASRIAGVGSVNVSERRSTTSCAIGLPRDREALRAALAPLGVRILGRQPAQEPERLVGARLPEVDLRQQIQRFRDDERARVLLQNQLEPLAGRARIAPGEVVVGDEQLLLREPAATDVDLREPVGRVAALGILLDEFLELLERLPGEPLVLLDRLELIVVAHRHTVLHEVGDLMPWVEGQEGLELLRGVVELGFAVIGLPDQEARARRVGGIRVPRDDLPEPGAGIFVPAPVQLLLAELIQLFRRKDRRGAGLEPSAAAQEEKERRQAERRNAAGVSAHEKS